MGIMIFDVPDNVKGIDCNSPLDAAKLTSLHNEGYRVITRYVRRVSYHTYDLSTYERQLILNAGFGLNIAQHVDANWVPSSTVGSQYGNTAAAECKSLGIAIGTTVTCDLEDVRPGTPAQAVIDYLKAWYAPVKSARYLPMVYLGFNDGISASDAYWKIPFQRYWSAYNLNTDRYPIIRGLCGKQGTEINKYGLRYDPDTYHADAKGGRATVMAIAPWTGL
jgi:hypothetical protein